MRRLLCAAIICLLGVSTATPILANVLLIANTVPPGQFYVPQTRDEVLNSTKVVAAHYVPNDQLQGSQSEAIWPNNSCMVNQLEPKSFTTTGGNQRRCPPVPPTAVAGNISSWQVTNLVSDMTAAVAQGINGFVVDWGGTGDNLPVAMLQAALIFDPAGRFKVILMPDTGYGTTLVSPTTITTLYNTNVDGTYTVYTHPATYRWVGGARNGKPQLSVLKPQTGWTTTQWQTFLTAMDTVGTGLAWAPCFGSIADAPTFVTAITQSVGLMPFGSPAVPDQYYYISLAPGQMTSMFSTGCGGGPCAYIGSWSSQGWQINGGTYYESVNSVAYRYGWMAMNAYFPSSSTTEIMLVTWNDFGESHAIRPSTNQYGWPSRGHYDLTGYYSKWWRTGTQPTITGDAIFYSYKPQTYAASHGATGSGVTVFPTINFGSTADNIEMLAFLTSAATLSTSIGPGYTQSCASGGICTMGKASFSVDGPTPAVGDATPVPDQAGTPVFSIIRGGNTVLSITGYPTLGNAQLPAAGTIAGQTSTGNCNTPTATNCWQAGLPDSSYYSNDTGPQ